LATRAKIIREAPTLEIQKFVSVRPTT